MRHLYSALLYALLPLVLLRLLLRSLRTPAYRRRLAERCGFFAALPQTALPALWLHAVSVGEVRAAAPLIRRLQRDYPGHPLVVTTTTPGGSACLRELFADEVVHVYLPWDLPGPVCRFLARVRPALLLLMETELWPNLLHHSRARGCRVVLINARLSAGAARRYRRVGPLMPVLREMLMNIDVALCQGQGDGERLLSLGLPSARVQVSGSLKYAAAHDSAASVDGPALRAALALGERPVLLAASTHRGEEAPLLTALARLRAGQPDCLLVLAPRHPERAPAVARLCRRRGWSLQRRSTGLPPGPEDAILLLDTLGELPQFYALATLAFIGGSLVAQGGHNPLEAAALGVPVVSGPQHSNFAAVNAALAQAGALEVVADERELEETLAGLMADPARRASMARAGRRVVQEARSEPLDAVLRAIGRLYALKGSE